MNVQQKLILFLESLDYSAAVISPGSRNAPIIQALTSLGKPNYSIIDERSAGFVALGMAKALGKPVVLCCTSGTALLNYYPAIAEAFYARVPLVILSADRPPEKIDSWDGQAIRQNNVFQNHRRAEFEFGTEIQISEIERLTRLVNAKIKESIPGPIHINVPIREPFYNVLKTTSSSNSLKVKASSIERKVVSLRNLQQKLGLSFNGENVLVFNGMQDAENVELKVDCLAWQTIQLSDICSNQTSEIDGWDAFLFNYIKTNFKDLEGLYPDVLITTGNTTVSKGLKMFLQKCKPKKHYHISAYNEVGQMFETKPMVVNPNTILLEDGKPLIGMAQWNVFKQSWTANVQEFNMRLRDLEWNKFNEFTAIKTVLESIPNNSIVHLANSMAVRYVSYLKEIADAKGLIIKSNRGTSGIDGCNSTALGEALVQKDTLYLITGDVAFLYDINALLNTQLPSNLKIIVLNNNGGGIFELINGPDVMGSAFFYQTTHQNVDIEKIVEGYGVAYCKASKLRQIERRLECLQEDRKLTVLEIITERPKNKLFYSSFKNII